MGVNFPAWSAGFASYCGGIPKSGGRIGDLVTSLTATRQMFWHWRADLFDGVETGTNGALLVSVGCAYLERVQFNYTPVKEEEYETYKSDFVVSFGSLRY